MKDFSKMSQKEFFDAQRKADLNLWSRYAIFARSVAGFNIFKGIFAVPKYVIFQRFQHQPRQLELIADGKHPEYRKKPNLNFDTATWNIMEVEFQLASQLGTDPKSLSTRSGSSTDTPPQK